VNVKAAILNRKTELGEEHKEQRSIFCGEKLRRLIKSAMICAGRKQLDFEGDQTRLSLMETDTNRAWWKGKKNSFNNIRLE